MLHSRESQALQYSMRDRLVALGWSEFDTVDDDLGRSAAGGVTRVGFERMVPRTALEKSARSQPAKPPASHATAAIGTSSAGVTIFSQQVLQYGIVEHRVRQ